MNFRKGQRRSAPEINLIAFIDVLLVILIFLMVSTTFSKTTSLQLTLPSANGDPSNSPKPLTVAIDSQGRYAVQQQRIAASDPAMLVKALREAAQDTAQNTTDITVEIHADAMASHQSVVQLMEAARNAGLVRLVFAVNVPASP
jgi:biopolymer transport protein ExbD